MEKKIAKFKVGGFYYDQLEVDEQLDYKRIVTAVSEYAPSVEVESSSADSLERVCSAVCYDNPELFYFVIYDLNLTADGMLNLKYHTANKKEAEMLIKKMREKRRAIIKEIMTDTEDPVEMTKKLYTYFLKNVRYASDEIEKDEPRQWIYNIQGVLMNNKAVCLGIALAIQYIYELGVGGVHSILVTGVKPDKNGSLKNAWNILQIDGRNYHMDVSSEMQLQEEKKKNKKKNSDEKEDSETYSCFLLTDAGMQNAGWLWSKIYPKAVRDV